MCGQIDMPVEKLCGGDRSGTTTNEGKQLCVSERCCVASSCRAGTRRGGVRRLRAAPPAPRRLAFARALCTSA